MKNIKISKTRHNLDERSDIYFEIKKNFDVFNYIIVTSKIIVHFQINLTFKNGNKSFRNIPT